MILDDIKTTFRQYGEFAEIDWQFAGFVNGPGRKVSRNLMLAAALASKVTREGDICLDLNEYAGRPLVDGTENEVLVCPALPIWLKDIITADSIGRPGEYKPLIIDEKHRLYLYRYWEYETSLGQYLKKQATYMDIDYDRNGLADNLARLFPDLPNGEFNYQKLAAFTALTKGLCIITGGPGTGKTSTVAGIMALLLERDPDLSILLAAPTGKAAARLQEAIAVTGQNLNCRSSIKSLISVPAATIHRLLGTIPRSPYFRHNAENRLPCDVLIIDEASMVDLPLMAKLVQALPDRAKLILIGDKDQLASVEAGAVLGDICAAAENADYTAAYKQAYAEIAEGEIPIGGPVRFESSWRDSIIELKKSYRFLQTGGIGALSKAANTGDSASAVSLIEGGSLPDITWLSLPRRGSIEGEMKALIIEHYSGYLKSADPITALRRFAGFQVLCAVREGPFGVEAINYYVEKILGRSGLIRPNSEWYHGRPILITKNNYQLNLYNGDIGIIFDDTEDGSAPSACFLMPDGILKKFSPLRLPEHETVFAMTVHKSQGSEFDNVLFILPDRESPVITRELIYTAVTRARNHLRIWSSVDVFRKGIDRKLRRTSGLSDILKQA